MITQYAVLLRGINVGGNNIIKMIDLKACLEAEGFTGVTTYIQSGNVILESGMSHAALVANINGALEKAFDYRAPIVVVSRKDMETIIAKAPRGFGSKPDLFRYDVIFLKDPLTAAEVMKNVMLKEGVDTAVAGPGVVYFSRLIARATQSKLSRVITLPIYKFMTIRNWNTTTKLVTMMKKEK